MKSKLPIFLLAIFLFALINLPRDWIDRLREQVVSWVSPTWQTISMKLDEPIRDDASLLSMQLSDQQIVKEWIEDEKRLDRQCETLKELIKISDHDQSKQDAKRRVEREKQYLALRSSSMPAQVVFREPSSWSSSIWISIGEADNRFLERTAIAINSPVLARSALIGVVEYVGETQSRVRLITDTGLVLAIRAIRGGEQNRELFHHVEDLLTRARARADLFSSKEEQERFTDILFAFKGRLSLWEEQELAKGEICGCSTSLFCSRNAVLKGTGFNCDFSDEGSSSIDFRLSRSQGNNSKVAKKLIQEGDLLVTSGLDGVFPAGIPVGITTKIAPLKNGAYTYELEAKPAAGDLLDLRVVFVLPPL